MGKVIVFTYKIISTLGPAGTDSERAAHHYTNRLRTNPWTKHEVVLFSSFEEVLRSVSIEKAHCGIVPAAYNELFQLHVQALNDGLYIRDVFILPTKEMVLAKGKYCNGKIKSIALHPSTESLVPFGIEKVYVRSKPLGIEKVVNGEVDAAIASRDVAEKHNLEIVESYGEIPMTWEVFALDWLRRNGYK